MNEEKMFSIPEITVEDLKVHRKAYVLVDVREPHELLGPGGHIEESILAPLGNAFDRFLMSADPHLSYVFICRAGVRSARACAFAYAYGFHKVYNMKGGMLAWNELNALMVS